MNKGIISVGIAFGLALAPTAAFAEDVVEEEPVVEEVVIEEPTPEPEPEPAPEPEPEPEPAYVPPPEAHDGVGGWAVVDPDTGRVHGVIVGTIESFNSVEARGGMGHEYMGCHSECVLRFQTSSDPDTGNVAGWGSTSGDEVVVTYNEPEDNFTVDERWRASSDEPATDVSIIEPGRGIVSRKVTDLGVEDADIEIRESYSDDEGNSVRIEYLVWGYDRKLFNYINGTEALDSLRSDVDTELLRDFSTTEDIVVKEESVVPVETLDEETNEIVITEEVVITESVETNTIIDEDNPFVAAIRAVTDNVVSFFKSVFGSE